jgi:hypothetical protein
MIRKVTDLIVAELSGLNFVDKIGGIVKELEVVSPNDGASDTKVYPVCGQDATGKHITFLPDTSKKSVIFFEDNGTNETGNDVRYNNYESSIRLIAWYNLMKINEDFTEGDLLTQTLIYNIPHTLPNSDYLTKIFIDFNGEVTKDKSIFGKYNFDEATWQYLNYPYDYAAIDLTVRYSIPRNASCFDSITIKPKTC